MTSDIAGLFERWRCEAMEARLASPGREDRRCKDFAVEGTVFSDNVGRHGEDSWHSTILISENTGVYLRRENSSFFS